MPFVSGRAAFCPVTDQVHRQPTDKPTTGRRRFPTVGRLLLALTVCAGLVSLAEAAPPKPRAARADGVLREPMSLSAQRLTQWSDGDDDVLLCRDKVFLSVGMLRCWADRAVAWFDRPLAAKGVNRLTVYLEGNVKIQRPGATVQDTTGLIEVATTGAVTLRDIRSREQRNGEAEPLFQRAVSFLKSPQKPQVLTGRVLFSYAPDDPAPEAPTTQPRPVVTEPGKPQSIRIYKRTSQGYTSETFAGQVQGERVTVLSGGINLLVENAGGGLTSLDVQADRMVIWSREMVSGDETDTQVELYLEGDVVVRRPEQTIRCNRMYYDLKRGLGVFVEAELETYSKSQRATLYLQARKFRQVAHWRQREGQQETLYSKFLGDKASVTSSTFRGRPGYKLQTTRLIFEQETVTELEPDPADPTGQKLRQVTDPETGEPVQTRSRPLTGMHNVLTIEEYVPVFYWPILQMDMEVFEGPLRRLRVSGSNDFGTGIESDWNILRLLGVRTEALPEDEQVKLMMDLDYWSERGGAVGLRGSYVRTGVAMPRSWVESLAEACMAQTFFPAMAEWGQELKDWEGPYEGILKAYYVNDTGEDNLGGIRSEVELENSDRGRFLWRHRQELPLGVSVTGELGYVSDENFLEEWREQEFDTGKDQETLIYAKLQQDIWAVTGLTKIQINDFNTVTEELPTLGFELIGQPLLNDMLTFFNSSQIGYVRYNYADRQEYIPPPPPPVVPGVLPAPVVPSMLGQEVNSDFSGARLDTRNEVNLPLMLDPVKVVPYVGGRLTYWGESLERRPAAVVMADPEGVRYTADSQTRLYGEAGVRASVPVWKVYPDVQDELLDLDGLAHKVLFYGDAFLAGSNVDFDEVVPYDLVDDTSDRQGRVRAMARNTARGFLPGVPLPDRTGRFIGTFNDRPIPDERYLVIQEGIHRGVEWADDLAAFRFGGQQRLQTKRGRPGQKTNHDWMALDLWTSLYPDDDRDNAGETLGPVEYDYQCQLGGRTLLTSSGAWEPWTQSVDRVRLGVVFQRPGRGSFAIRHTWLNAVQSSILSMIWNYQLNQKWTVSTSGSYDFDEDEELSSSFVLTRSGRDWIWQLGLSYSPTQDNTNVFVQVSPKAFPKVRLSQRFFSSDGED